MNSPPLFAGRQTASSINPRDLTEFARERYGKLCNYVTDGERARVAASNLEAVHSPHPIPIGACGDEFTYRSSVGGSVRPACSLSKGPWIRSQCDSGAVLIATPDR